jgi:hypothetical protein
MARRCLALGPAERGGGSLTQGAPSGPSCGRIFGSIMVLAPT